MVSEKQEVQADEVEQEAPKAAPKTTRTRKPKATEQAKTEAAAAETPAEKPVQESQDDAQDQEKPAVQEKTPETDVIEKAAEKPAQEAAETPQANLNSLSVTNSGATTFCRVSGKTIATGQTVTISYKNAFLKSKAKRNFEQLNELAGKKRFSVEG